MSSKAAKRKKEYQEREARRMKNRKRQSAIRNAKGIQELAEAMGIPLGGKYEKA